MESRLAVGDVRGDTGVANHTREVQTGRLPRRPRFRRVDGRVSSRVVKCSEPLEDIDDGLRGFAVEDADRQRAVSVVPADERWFETRFAIGLQLGPDGSAVESPRLSRLVRNVPFLTR
jgi:hypothetical protein